MTEDFLHFIWKFGLFERSGIIADTGDEIEVRGLGEHNSDAGPDFLNTRIKIGNTVWAGNTEIHTSSSDWNAHHHDRDNAYDNVILHAVFHYDHPVKRSSGEVVPTVILKFDDRLFQNYSHLLGNRKGPACYPRLKSIDRIIIDVWLNSLVVERLEQKTDHIAQLLKQYRNNWEEVFYIVLARSFGFGLNAVPFELMARNLPYALIMRHSDNLKQIEALIMGQAGFLKDAVLFNDYYQQLRSEYIHLSNKYNLKPVSRHLWKFLRLRPVNFPTIRLAQFAALLYKSEGLFSRVIACSDIAELISLFNVRASEFWNTHYTFDTPSPTSVKQPGNSTIHILIINTVIPFLFIYGKMTGNIDLKERAISLLGSLPPEDNRIIRRWEKSGIKADSAFISQGLLQLNNNYCVKRRCLACSIGTSVITF
ncbi:MAG TPA: DUF2851 family protein [Bacteroidales bacterium]|jgi:hypothetical protein|nr:DUF2851 family protein [Bacteroidales bacterium]